MIDLSSPWMMAGQALLGAGVGYASGLFGVGGGFMLTPLLHSLFGLPVPIAVGSGLSQMIAVGISATRRHAAAGYVDGRLAGVMAPGIMLGSVFGAALLHRLDQLGTVRLGGMEVPWISLIVNSLFVLLLAGIAIRLWREQQSQAPEAGAGQLCWPGGPWPVALPACGIPRCSLVSLTACGLLLGVLAGLLGIGGGVLMIPLLCLGYGIPMRTTIGTSALLILISALIGTGQHALHGHVDVRVVLALLAGSTIGVQVGAWHSLRLPVAGLRKAFALLVTIVALFTLVRLLH